MGEGGETRYQPLVDSENRTDRELSQCWELLVREVKESAEYLGREFEDGLFTALVAGIGQGSTSGATRKAITKAREETRLEVMSLAISSHPNQQGKCVSSWKERDKLTTAFLLNILGHRYHPMPPLKGLHG